MKFAGKIIVISNILGISLEISFGEKKPYFNEKLCEASFHGKFETFQFDE